MAPLHEFCAFCPGRFGSGADRAWPLYAADVFKNAFRDALVASRLEAKRAGLPLPWLDALSPVRGTAKSLLSRRRRP